MVLNNLNNMGLEGLDFMCRSIGMEVDINDGRIVGYDWPKKAETPAAGTAGESK